MINLKFYKRKIAIILLVIFIPSLFPVNMIYASNNGPKAPEAASFEPVDTTDMVNLATGDMNYVLPVLNVPSPEGGYPLVMSYHGGIAYDLESSWIGLGWNLNPGAIERGINGYPDDWKEGLIRTRNFYNFESNAIDVGVSVDLGESASLDVGITYGWDSNGGRYGTVNLGAGGKIGNSENSAEGSVSIGYSNKSGAIFNVSGGYSDESGAGVGGSVGTNGAGIGANYSFSMDKGESNSSSLKSKVGISLSSEGIGGSYSLSSGIGSLNFSINSGTLGEYTETNIGLQIPIAPGAWLKFGKRKVKYEKNETTANFVNGPLYFSSFNHIQGNDDSYSNDLGTEQKRNFFMDVYEQVLPKSQSQVVSYENIYQSQKYSFTYPAYDNYVVNAQGLAGSMTPRLFENGVLVGKSQNFEIEDHEISSGTLMQTGILVPPVNGSFSSSINHFGMNVPYDYRSLESYIMNWNYDLNRKFSNAFGNLINQNSQNQTRFYFENSFPSNLKVNESSTNPNTSNNLLNYIGYTNNKVNNGNRNQNANYVEVFTNNQLINSNYSTTGVLNPFNGDAIYDRSAENGFAPDGIGAYKITTPDGKTYHYAMPVYQYEEIYRQLKNHPENMQNNDPTDNFYPENSFYQEQRKIQPYATHWVLTAVTGPDFYDSNNNGIADSDDYGYWVRFDYGKWTEGYTWRSPYNGFNDFDQYANYSNNENAREYGWGRKQLTYLNKVVTRTHTALMIKSVRHDSKSKVVGNELLAINPISQQPIYGYPSFEGDNGIFYPMQRTLKLDEIILVKNNNDNTLSANQLESITNLPNQLVTVNWTSPIVKNHNTNNNKVQYKINQQNLVLDSGDLPKDENGNYLIYQNAEKIIKLNQDYSLATNSPHSDAPATDNIAAKGRLTLKSIKTLGRNGFDYMPETRFDYFSNNIPYQDCNNATCNIKNPWGYHNSNPKIWSLQRITTPTGAKIEFDLEKDTYWTEAFSRRYWTDDLMFKGTAVGNDLHIYVRNKTGSSVPVNFTEYFMPDERVFLDLIIWKRNRWISGLDKEEGKWKLDLTSDKVCKVSSVTNDLLTIVVKNQASLIEAEIGCELGMNYCYFSRGNPALGSHEFEPENPREHGQPNTPSPGVGNDASHHRMYYNILANRVPGEGTGGGLRVKSISSIDEANNTYTTNYNYTNPEKNRTSGITSFAPVRGLKYIPFQADIPAPRVMYEYVTVTESTSNNGVLQNNGKTIYQFNVLENATNIFSKNLSSGDFFKSEVVTNDLINPYKALKSARIKLHDNTSQLGSVVSISKYNNKNQLLSKSYTKRKSLDELINSTLSNTTKGAVQESFQSLKSIYRFNSNYIKSTAGASLIFVNYTTTQKDYVSSELIPFNRFLNVSTKVIYKPYIDYTQEIDGTGKIVKTWQEDQDPVNGLFNTTITSRADGKLVRSQIVPAYTKYGGTGGSMASKVLDINNKNMLTQEAMNITSIKVGNDWKTTNASISTWNNEWKYRDENSGTDVSDPTRKVWRKHKSFVWKENLSNDGTYQTVISKDDSYFNFGLGIPLTNKWQKISEVTRYSHWSAPIESKDINNNFSSSKTADRGSKIIVAGNSRYTEMYYSGAEHVKSNNLFDGEVYGANFKTNEVAHTGSYSVKAVTPNDRVFEINGSSGNNNYYSNPDSYNETFRPGKYSISYWTLDSLDPAKGSNLIFNGVSVEPTDVIIAGCWKQLNYIVDIQPNSNVSLYLKNTLASGSRPYYYDDFRMNPISSKVNSFVYDQNTGLLSYILDGNNMGTAYKYDDAGRLLGTYVETENHSNLYGGFKLTSQFRQKYKNSTDTVESLDLTLNNCLNNVEDTSRLNMSIKNDYLSTFENRFITNVEGGSGNYLFQYRWQKNDESGEFTNWINGSQTQKIPYFTVKCNSGTYDKKWNFNVKITDLVTGHTREDKYSYSTKGCQFDERNTAPIQISKIDSYCGNDKYSFKLHKKDISQDGSFTYEYAYYNPSLDFNNQNFININSFSGDFCPNWSKVSDQNSESGYRDYVLLAIKTTNLSTGEVTKNIIAFFGDQSDEVSDFPTVQVLDVAKKYQSVGNLIILNEKKGFLDVVNVNKIVH